jgi:hypothetical protein
MTAVRALPIAAIEAPKKWRPIKKKTINELVLSLNQDGLLHPIGVRPGADPESYILVFGKHRLEAARKSGWTEIAAQVMDIDEAAAKSATEAENLFRNSLTPADRVLAFKDWSARYVALHPEVSGRGKAGGLATAAKVEAERTGRAPEGRAKAFDDHAAEVTGISPTVIKEHVAAGKNLSEEELGILSEHDVPLAVIKQLGKLPDGQKEEAIALINSGLGGHEAIATATLPPNATHEQVGDPDVPIRTEADLDDDEWLETYCGEVLARLKFQATYRKDALLYRHSQEMRQKLRNASKKLLKQSRSQNVGPFYHRFTYFLNVNHPSTWSPCGPCGGSGMTGDMSKCGTCNGHAYLIKQGGR